MHDFHRWQTLCSDLSYHRAGDNRRGLGILGYCEPSLPAHPYANRLSVGPLGDKRELEMNRRDAAGLTFACLSSVCVQRLNFQMTVLGTVFHAAILRQIL